MIEVFSTGGGTQSTAIAALIVQGRLPKPDFVVIADTGREMPTTWEYLDAVTRPALKSVGIDIHRVPSSLISVPEHGLDWVNHNGNTIIIPVFSNQNGPGKLPNFCTSRWKVEVVDRYLSRNFGITPSKRRKWIGFSFDEAGRWTRMQNGDEYTSGLIRFPLVDLLIKRQDAIRIVEKMGWPTPPRSRCWMCPNQSDHEWREVQQDYPALFEQAIKLDESIRERDPHAFLHSTIKPLREADLSQEDDLFSASCPSGECFL